MKEDRQEKHDVKDYLQVDHMLSRARGVLTSEHYEASAALHLTIGVIAGLVDLKQRIEREQNELEQLRDRPAGKPKLKLIAERRQV